MNIIICEDTAKDRDILCSHIEKYFSDNNRRAEISVYETGESFLADTAILKSKAPKIAFLDIFMAEIDGVDVAKKIRETDEDMVIIFTTASREHGVDGYSVDAMQYLVKPVEYENVEKVFGRCVRLFADSRRSITVLSDRKTIKILLKDITHIEIYGHDCLIHTLSETITTRMPLDEIEREVNGDTFLRTNRSYIANMRYIDDMEENDFLLANSIAVPISRNMKKTVKQAYKKYAFALSRGM